MPNDRITGGPENIWVCITEDVDGKIKYLRGMSRSINNRESRSKIKAIVAHQRTREWIVRAEARSIEIPDPKSLI